MGAAICGGRWNAKGQRVVYASDSYSCALLETLAHANIGRVPRGFASIEIEIPAEITIEEIKSDDLPSWNSSDVSASQTFGSRWYAEMRTPVLVVPSVPSGGMGRNVVINQMHPEFKLISVSAPQPVKWYRRLFRRHRTPKRK